MKPIKFVEDDGTVQLFNPRFVTEVKAVHSEDEQNWCLVLGISNGNGYAYTYTKVYATETECKNKLDKIETCMTL